jgi:uncharacterized membrane protein
MEMAQFCSSCGAQMPDGAVVCSACGKGTTSTSAVAAQAGTTGGLADNVAGLLAYITIIPAIIFLVIEPYNKNRFIRFHSFQNIFFCVAWIILSIGLGIIGHIPVLGWITLFIWPLIGLAGFILWLVLMLKAYQGQMFKLPVIGDMAEKQANTV